MEEIESGAVSAMTDSSASELLDELNGKRKKWCLWKIAATIGAIIAFTAQFNPWVLGVYALIITAAYYYDQLRKTTVLFYDFDPEAEAHYQALHDGFEKIKGCQRAWHVEAKGDVSDPKYHAGANMVIRRKAINFTKGLPPYVKTNIEVPVIPAGKQLLYFFPERVLVYENNKVGAVAYSDLEFTKSPIRFIEEETVPRDSQIVDRTWRYTNKKGGPDKRFKDIMFLSMVVSVGDAHARPRIRRSSASTLPPPARGDRMYLVRSIELNQLSPSDTLRRSLISHFATPYAQDEQRVENLRNLCESDFEREVYDILTERGYRVIPQVKVGEYRIDMVVEGHNDTRLAVECDGDRYHGADRWDDDMNRQRILERVGWQFWRSFASNFVRNRRDVVDDLIATLTERGIEPIGSETAPRSIHTEHRRVIAFPVELPEGEPLDSQELAIEPRKNWPSSR